MSKELSAFYDLLMPEVPGCTVPLIDQNLIQVARDFCERTSAWKSQFAAVNTVAGQAEYYLDPQETQAEVVRITKLTIAGNLLWEDVGKEPPTRWPLVPSYITPRYRREDPPFTMSLDLRYLTLLDGEIPTAAVAGGFVVEGAVKPKQTATRLPDFLYSQYSEGMRFGVLARLMVMAKKPWTDRGLATAYFHQYQSVLGFAGMQADNGGTRSPLRTRKAGI